MKMDKRIAVAVMITLGFAGRSTGQATQQPGGNAKIASKEANEAEADYRKAVAEAEAAYKGQIERARGTLISRLNGAREESAKAVKLDEAIAIRSRVSELVKEQAAGQSSPERKARRPLAGPIPFAAEPVKEQAAGQGSPERKARRALADAIQGVVWIGSPHGPVTFDASGLIKTPNPNQKPWRWEAVDKNTVLARYDDGNIDVFFFDLANGVVASYNFGIPVKSRIAWTAKRTAGP
jgi:hypothetical protein